MKNFIIKALGGYTKQEQCEAIYLQEKLAKKYVELREKMHTKRDPKTGRFVKR